MDDTDNLESKGTGYVVEEFRKLMARRGVETQAISRHQLYFHEDVPYTSHNSVMCTEMDVPKDSLDEIIKLGIEHLTAYHAPRSDPGLCVACMEDIPSIAALIDYGRRAKNALLTKDEAYQVAREQNVHLSEHGGTGDGVIGALAGVGLRIFGFDGRIKGKKEAGADGDIITAAALLEKTGFPQVVAINGEKVPPDGMITLTEGRIKAVWLNWQNTVLVLPSDQGASYTTLPKKMLRVY